MSSRRLTCRKTSRLRRPSRILGLTRKFRFTPRQILRWHQSFLSAFKVCCRNGHQGAGILACRFVRGTRHSAHCAASRVAEVVALHARYADLVVLGQPDSENGGEVDAQVPEDVVLSAGRPALVVPYIGAGEEIGKRVLIAWDGGREAARAVNDALPLLENAEFVAVLVVNPSQGAHGEEPGADIALHLARHGIAVEAQHIEVRDLSTGNALLSRLADEAIDLLVMGAYGHSRLREMVLGGMTREVFQQMTVPVLMSH